MRLTEQFRKVHMRGSRTEYTIKNTVSNLSVLLITSTVAYVCRVLFVRIMETEYLGVSGLFSNVLSMLSLAELGIGSAIGYALYLPVSTHDEEKIVSLMKYYGKAYRIIGICVGVIGLLMMPFLKFIIREAPSIKENIYYIYLFFLFNTTITYFYSYKGTLLYVSQKNYITQWIHCTVILVQNIAQILILLLTKQYYLYLIIQTVCVLTYNIWISQTVDRRFPFLRQIQPTELSKTEKKELFINTKALTINKVGVILVNNTDNIAVTYFRGLVTTGIASNYTLLVSTLSSVCSQFFSGFTASIGNMNALESEEKKLSFFRAFYLANFWIFGWATIGIAFVSSDLVRLLFGDSFVLGNIIPFLLAINLYLVGMNNAVYAYQSTMGLFRYGQYLILITAGINLFLDVVLGRRFGLPGIYAATAIARITTNVWFEPWMVLKHGFHRSPISYYKKYGLFLLLLLIEMGICGYLCSLCHFKIAINTILKILICSIIPNGLLFICFHKKEEGKELLKMIGVVVKKIKNKRHLKKAE